MKQPVFDVGFSIVDRIKQAEEAFIFWPNWVSENSYFCGGESSRSEESDK